MEYGKMMGHAVRLLSNLWKRELDYRTNNSGVECLTGVQIGILEYIHDMYERNIDIFQKDVESTFKIRRSTVSVILKTMEEHGLIDRVSVSEDARLKKLVPTELAMQHRGVTQDIVDGLANKMTEGISEEDMKTFLKVAEKMVDYLESCEGVLRG
ncbi:MAG: MarR family transcriptional regulator [Eubacteriaceae bacterium]|nr:MarR family transcriptional regulator [Eubacteriaceae bacterium]